jgi:hypothetical protein
MCFGCNGTAGSGDGDASSPAFSLAEHAAIIAWARAMRPRGLRVRVVTNYEGIEEALHVLPRWEDTPRWLVWHTATGRVAVTLIPGLPRMVDTLDDALSHVAAEVNAEDG